MSFAFAIWTCFLAAISVLLIIAIALGIMLRLVEPQRALVQLLALLCGITLLIMLPEIILHLWLSLGTWQQLGTIALVGILVLAMLKSRYKRPKTH